MMQLPKTEPSMWWVCAVPSLAKWNVFLGPYFPYRLNKDNNSNCGQNVSHAVLDILHIFNEHTFYRKRKLVTKK